MKIATRKDIIESILINAQPFLERKDPTNITSHVLVEANDGLVTIKATDNEIGLKIESDQFEIIKEGSFTANGKKLLEVVRSLKSDTITFESKDENLFITQKSAKFKLPMFDYNEYPSFPTIENKSQISLDALTLIQSLKKIVPTIDTNNPKYELNGALIDIKKDKTFFVGTDTRRLGVVEVETNSNEELSLIIPKKTIIEIQKLFLDTIEIFYDETYLIIKNDQFFLFSRLINGRFPDYQRIIPQTLKHQLTLNKKAFIDAMKMISIISPEIKITFESGTITFQTLYDNQEGEIVIEAPIKMESPFTFALNSKYLFDFLAQIDTEKFIMGLNEPNLPFLVKSQNFLTVIMPIIL